eukprot:CAMPEP_0184043562 /NCGR_PEP_ID=MMETSP0955-20130417/66988_1 /TAXON_ID=627963 /ORGANISM="Aplanochytrium sp, Strain PBS07" /LENGTH=65 /DNA_ID=CAMNT_0026334481 /DNA_START=376 /DNA_END=576 /DNA_ORIENTATION=+
MMKEEIRRLEDSGAPKTEIQDMKSFYDMMALTPTQEYKLIKTARLARRGKIKPKKGEGKRSKLKK